MHRFYSESPVTSVGETVILSPEESAHAARVLRLQPGEEIRLIDGENLWKAELTTVSEKATEALAVEQCLSPEAPCKATLFQGLPKADKLELIAQKATELGMWSLWPVEMERSVARIDPKGNKKQDRLQRIAMEAAKQSGRAHVPEVLSPFLFSQALKTLQMNPVDLILVAWEEEHSLPLSKAVQAYVSEKGLPKQVILVIGPEGGISQAEWEKLHELGAVSVTLGPRILRTETAGLCALSVLWTALGEM